jgi:hypothetical protein
MSSHDEFDSSNVNINLLIKLALCDSENIFKIKSDNDLGGKIA